MNEILLRDPHQPPVEVIISKALREAFPAYEELIRIITTPEYGLELVWNYYNDGKAWLCKTVFKKKTICWISVWDGHFKTAFYFTDITSPGIDALGIDESVKENFRQQKHIGKLISLEFEISRKEQVADVLKVVGYKKSLK